MTWIVDLPVVFVSSQGQPTPGRIALGLPTQISDVEAHCAVALDGMYPGVGPIIGGNTLQAIVLAVRLLGALLHDWLASGGRVLDPKSNADVGLDAIFGPLLRS